MLFQSGMPIQTHTALKRDAAGRVLVVCTFEGIRAVLADGLGDAPTAPVERTSPACVFSQLLASADLPVVATVPRPHFSIVVLAEVEGRSVLSVFRLHPYSIRAPPMDLVQV